MAGVFFKIKADFVGYSMECSVFAFVCVMSIQIDETIFGLTRHNTIQDAE